MCSKAKSKTQSDAVKTVPNCESGYRLGTEHFLIASATAWEWLFTRSLMSVLLHLVSDGIAGNAENSGNLGAGFAVTYPGQYFQLAGGKVTVGRWGVYSLSRYGYAKPVTKWYADGAPEFFSLDRCNSPKGWGRVDAILIFDAPN